MTTSLLTRRQQKILAALGEGQSIRMRRAFPQPTRYQLGPDFVDEDDVRKLVLAKLIAPLPIAGGDFHDFHEAEFRITDAGRAMLEQESRR